MFTLKKDDAFATHDESLTKSGTEESILEKLNRERQEEMDREYALAMANEINGSEIQHAVPLTSFNTSNTSTPFVPPQPTTTSEPFSMNVGDGDEQILALLDRWKASDIFTAVFESKYGSVHPNFNCGTARSALLKAKREAKMLMVYLHHPLHDNTDLFCL